MKFFEGIFPSASTTIKPSCSSGFSRNVSWSHEVAGSEIWDGYEMTAWRSIEKPLGGQSTGFMKSKR